MPARASASSPIGCRCCAVPAGACLPMRRSAPCRRRPQLDTWLSAWKIEGRRPPEDARLVLEAYADLLSVRGAVDFDDLVVRACDLLETDARLRLRWQSRFSHVCVDEFQDVDAAQLRLVRLLAAPEDNLFVVGDDDQTIYAWRLADVRRILRFSTDYPAARRVMLATNYRCPPSVVAASARMVAVNRERFTKPIRAPAGASDDGQAITAWSTADPSWADGVARLAAVEDAARRSLCFLSRTRGELTPSCWRWSMPASATRRRSRRSSSRSASSRSSTPRAASRRRSIPSTSCAGSGSVAAGHVTIPHRITSATRITPRSMPCSAGRPASHASTPSSPPTTRRGRGSRPFAIHRPRSSWRPSTPRRDASGRRWCSSASKPTESRIGAR